MEGTFIKSVCCLVSAIVVVVDFSLAALLNLCDLFLNGAPPIRDELNASVGTTVRLGDDVELANKFDDFLCFRFVLPSLKVFGLCLAA